jgi:hypothetical protein
MCAPARRGVALVAALALLALASALVLGTFGAGRAMSRATANARAAVRADAGARRALARVVAGWEGSLDSMPAGAVVARPLTEDDERAPPLILSATVRRLSEAVFLIVVDARVTSGSALIARRRYRWLVEHSASGDSSNHRVAPSSLAGWSLDETN